MANAAKGSLSGKQPRDAIQAKMITLVDSRIIEATKSTSGNNEGIDENADLPDIRSEYVWILILPHVY